MHFRKAKGQPETTVISVFGQYSKEQEGFTKMIIDVWIPRELLSFVYPWLIAIASHGHDSHTVVLESLSARLPINSGRILLHIFCAIRESLKAFYAAKTGLGKVENIKVRMIEWSFLLFRMSSRYISHRWEVFEQQDVHVEYKWKPNEEMSDKEPQL